MTSTLLHACLRGCCRRNLQYVALTFSPGLGLPQKRKHELVDDIEMHASSSDGNHEAVCRFLLSLLTKPVIDAHIRSVSGCAKPTTKQVGGAAAAADGGGAYGGAADDLDSLFTPDGSDADLPPPPFPPPPAAPQGGPAELAPSLVAPDDLEPSAGIIVLADGADRRKLRRKLHKRWAKAASRNILSRNITSAIKTVLERIAPDRTIADVLRDVARMVGNPLTRGAALVFAHRQLQKSLIMRPARRRRKPRRFVEHADGLPPCMEMRLMWEEDLWKHKHNLLMTPEIFRHNKKFAIACPSQDGDEEEEDDW